jgi:hypothetical protein
MIKNSLPIFAPIAEILNLQHNEKLGILFWYWLVRLLHSRFFRK